MRLRIGRHATSSLQLRPTSWLGSPGLHSRAATSRGGLQLLSQLESRCISLGTADEFEGHHVHSPKVCTGTAGTNKQSNGVPLICVRQWSSTSDRLIERTRADFIMTRRTDLHLQPDTFEQTTVVALSSFPCSRAADYTLSYKWRPAVP